MAGLAVAVDDPRAVEIVWRYFDSHAVTGKDADSVAAHLARNVAENKVAIIEFDAKHRVRQSLNDVAFELDLFFFSHQR